MKRLTTLAVVFSILVSGLYWSYAKAAEPTTTITLTIPTASLPRIVAAMEGLYPIPLIEDPENPGQMIPQYTSNQWAKQCVLHFVRRSVRRYEQKLSNEVNVVLEDPSIVD